MIERPATGPRDERQTVASAQISRAAGPTGLHARCSRRWQLCTANSGRGASPAAPVTRFIGLAAKRGRPGGPPRLRSTRNADAELSAAMTSSPNRSTPAPSWARGRLFCRGRRAWAPPREAVLLPGLAIADVKFGLMHVRDGRPTHAPPGHQDSGRGNAFLGGRRRQPSRRWGQSWSRKNSLAGYVLVHAVDQTLNAPVRA